MKNYYEILEVDKNASQEVIDKAYRILAKKYHPDLQQGANQQDAAEKMKIINAAYDILSNQSKREEYDQQLEEEQQASEISVEEHERIMRENYALKQELNKMGNRPTNHPTNNSTDEGSFGNMTRVLNEQIQAAYEKAYYDAYIQDLKSRGYKIRYTHDFKYYVKMIIAIIITLAICFLVYQIPFVKNYFQTSYFENEIFQAIVDIIKNTVSTKF